MWVQILVERGEGLNLEAFRAQKAEPSVLSWPEPTQLEVANNNSAAAHRNTGDSDLEKVRAKSDDSSINTKT